MPRAARSVAKRARHKKWLTRAKGFRGRRRRAWRLAKEAVLIAGRHAYHDRRKRKAVFRAQWQTTINAAIRKHGLAYSRFMHELKSHRVGLNRKVLAELARDRTALFDEVVAAIKEKTT